MRITFDKTKICMRKFYLTNYSAILSFLLVALALHGNAQCEPGQVALTITIDVDAWGQETYWEIVPAGNTCGDGTVAFGSNANVGCAGIDPANGEDGYPDNTVVDEGPFCLAEGQDYSLIFVDSYGDGGLSFELYEDGSFSHFYVGAGEGNTWTFNAGNNGLPENDSPCGAFEVLTDGTELEISNIGAIFQATEPLPAGGNCGLMGFWCEANLTNTVWAYFTPEADITYEITTCGSLEGFDTQLALYKASDCSDFSTFELIASNDDMGGCSTSNGFSSRMFASCLDPESVYYIQLDGWNAATGTAALSVTPYDGGNDLDAQVRDIQCPLNKGEAGDGNILPYLTASGSNFTCVWTGPDGFSSTENYLYNLSAGTYELTLTSSCGEIFTNDFQIDQPAMWTVIADATGPDCEASANGSIELNVSGATAPYTYAWAGPDNFVSELFNPSSLDTGGYNVVITDENNCIFTQGYYLQPLNNFSFSLGDDTLICIYSDFVVSGPPGYSYEWQDESVNQFYEIVGEEWGIGEHAVLLTATTDDGCTFTDALEFVVDACIGVESVGTTNLSIYPNPFQDQIAIQFDENLSWVFAELIDATGRVATTSAFNSGNIPSWHVEVASGVYTLRLITEKGICYSTLVRN
jgi:hypothetical protein